MSNPPTATQILFEWGQYLKAQLAMEAAGNTQGAWTRLTELLKESHNGPGKPPEANDSVRTWSRQLSKEAKTLVGELGAEESIEFLCLARDVVADRIHQRGERKTLVEQDLNKVLVDLLEKSCGIEDALNNLGNVEPRPNSDRWQIRVEMFGPDGTSNVVPGKPMRLRLYGEPGVGREEALAVYILEYGQEKWQPLIPNRHEPEGVWLVPGVEAWIPDEVSIYKLLAPPVLRFKIIATSQAVSFPMYLRPAVSRTIRVARERQVLEERRNALIELHKRWQQLPGQFCVVDV